MEAGQPIRVEKIVSRAAEPSWRERLRMWRYRRRQIARAWRDPNGYLKGCGIRIAYEKSRTPFPPTERVRKPSDDWAFQPGGPIMLLVGLANSLLVHFGWVIGIGSEDAKSREPLTTGLRLLRWP